MRIITISREFGSGGRELGKRLADILGYAYYDKEIVAAIAKESGMDEGYIEKLLAAPRLRMYPITIGYPDAAVSGAGCSDSTSIIWHRRDMAGRHGGGGFDAGRQRNVFY